MEFGVDGAGVGFDGGEGDAEVGGDLFVGESVFEAEQDLVFAVGEVGAGRGGAFGWEDGAAVEQRGGGGG